MIGPLEGIMLRQVIRFTLYIVYNESITFLVLSKLIIIHNGEKPSNCNQCDMSLDNHCKTHTSEKPYQYYLCYVSLCKIRNILFELLIVCSFNIILSDEMSLYCNICDMSLSKHIRMHTCEKPFQYKPHHVSICKIINIHISKIFSKYSIYRVSRCKYSMIHICKKPKQHSLYIIYYGIHILYIFKVLAIYLLSVVLFWSLLIKYRCAILVNDSVSDLICYSLIFRNFYVISYYCFQLVQINFIHEYFTSHTITYGIVCYGGGNTIRNNFLVNLVTYRFTYYYAYQSNRRGLLRLVNLTPVRWPLIVMKTVMNLVLECYTMVDTILISTCMPFYCTKCDFLSFASYHKSLLFSIITIGPSISNMPLYMVIEIYVRYIQLFCGRENSICVIIKRYSVYVIPYYHVHDDG